jgi:hypothetical protein
MPIQIQPDVAEPRPPQADQRHHPNGKGEGGDAIGRGGRGAQGHANGQHHGKQLNDVHRAQQPEAIEVEPASAKITKKVKAALKMSWLI